MVRISSKVRAWPTMLLTLAISLAAWIAICLVDSTWYYFTGVFKSPEPGKSGVPPWPKIVEYNLPYWVATALLTVPVVWLTRRFSFGTGRNRRAIGVHALCIVPFGLLHIGMFRFYNFMMKGGWEAVEAKLYSTVRGELSTTLDKEIVFYVMIVGAVSAYDYYRRFKEKERAAAALELEQARLQASLSEAKLGALKMQLQPHFLFNVMHAISTLILRGDAQAANQMLLHLSSFLRMTLDSGETPVVPLPVELEFLDAYLRIQRVRFGDRLQVEVEIAEDVKDAIVPNLILQPLVENSIRHGIGSDPGQGVITIRAERANGQLMLQVHDNGPGLRSEGAVAEGVGLTNIRARLEQLYPGAHRFTLERGATGGTVATIVIPYQLVPAGERGEEP
jgi:two-component system, LytTR family, sensor kinase